MTAAAAPKLRVFAGPNGSGKTTLAMSLAREFRPDGMFHLNYFVNADWMQKTLAAEGLDLALCPTPIDASSLTASIRQFRSQAALACRAHARWITGVEDARL